MSTRRLQVGVLVLAALLGAGAGRAWADAFSAGPDVLAPSGWPNLEQARQAVDDWLRAHGRETRSYPGNDRGAFVDVGKAREVRVDLGPLFGPKQRFVERTWVPEGDGLRVELRGLDELTPELRQACAAKSPAVTAVTLLDTAGHPALVEHRFCDCATPALIVAVLTAPGADASFAAEVAHAAIVGARKPDPFARPSGPAAPDAGK